MPDADVIEDTTDETVTESTESTEEPGEEQTIEEQTEATDDDEADDADTFPRTYVVALRKESAGYRDRAKAAEARVDELSKRLHTSLVAQTGKLADPTDLPFDAAHLDDAAALDAAIDALTAAKPHLKSRRPFGDVGQGVKGNPSTTVDLAGMLRARA